VDALPAGSWTARWGRWMVGLVASNNHWSARLWRWPLDTSVGNCVELACASGFKSPRAAARWACRLMHRDGAIVMVLDAPDSFRLEDVLDFGPALALVDG
jgi:hypothetical protein